MTWRIILLIFRLGAPVPELQMPAEEFPTKAKCDFSAGIMGGALESATELLRPDQRPVIDAHCVYLPAGWGK